MPSIELPEQESTLHSNTSRSLRYLKVTLKSRKSNAWRNVRFYGERTNTYASGLFCIIKACKSALRNRALPDNTPSEVMCTSAAWAKIRHTRAPDWGCRSIYNATLPAPNCKSCELPTPRSRLQNAREKLSAMSTRISRTAPPLLPLLLTSLFVLSRIVPVMMDLSECKCRLRWVCCTCRRTTSVGASLSNRWRALLWIYCIVVVHI